MIKAFLKKIIPEPIRRYLRTLENRLFGLERHYRKLNTEQVFESIYANAVWGKDEHGNPISGDGSHKKTVVDPYVDVVKNIISRNDIRTVADLGCGDFAVGSRLVGSVEDYIACDISGTILEQNRKRYEFENLSFTKLDLAEDELPVADLAIVRQVLQHLSNRDIKRFVDRLNEANSFKFLLLTEHLPAIDSFIANKDKPSGPNIRISLDSGVVLHEPPFLLKHRNKEEVLVINEPTGGVDANIQTTLYHL